MIKQRTKAGGTALELLHPEMSQYAEKGYCLKDGNWDFIPGPAASRRLWEVTSYLQAFGPHLYSGDVGDEVFPSSV